MSQTTERAFETYVEEILLTTCGWKSGTNAEWDKERALFPAQVVAFIQDTQPKLWADMKTLHAGELEAMILAALVKELDSKGSLHVLRHGFKFYGKTFHLAYFKPAHGANAEVLGQVNKNRLTVTRQVPCHASVVFQYCLYNGCAYLRHIQGCHARVHTECIHRAGQRRRWRKETLPPWGRSCAPSRAERSTATCCVGTHRRCVGIASSCRLPSRRTALRHCKGNTETLH